MKSTRSSIAIAARLFLALAVPRKVSACNTLPFDNP